MNELQSLVDWSRAQFALTAMYHWIFVPLTIGLSVIVALMETFYVKTRNDKWLGITKFWMTLFGINFAIGVATGLILEFEFGTNWSNYSWFVGDIFGAPLAIEGIFAFFMETTFIAVMFFGWGKFSKGFHLAATWLTALGTSISALWILVANSWMQHPVGMEFDPETTRNVMNDFFALVLSPVAITKVGHTIFSGWTLAGVFVVGVSAWMLWKKRNTEASLTSIKVGAIVGLVGMVLTMVFGDGSAKVISRVQPMKLAAMEGLYDGEKGQNLVAFGILNGKTEGCPCDFAIEIPYGLSILARGDYNAFVPGINDIIKGLDITAEGDTISTVSYAERIAKGRLAQEALRDYDSAKAAGDQEGMASARERLDENMQFFGYGYLESPEEAVPNVPMTFYAFHIMIILGVFLTFVLLLVLFLYYRKRDLLTRSTFVHWLCIISIPLVWICSQAGWVTAEVGRQPWVIEGLMPTKAAVSALAPGSVKLTFYLFAILFACLLVAEIGIMCRHIAKKSQQDITKL